MEIEAIKKLLEEELEDKEHFNWPEPVHQDPSYFLTEPFKASFYNIETQEEELHWVVANMNPESNQEGALIILDENSLLFGLAAKGDLFEEGSGELIGWYGGIRETLEYL